MKATQDSTAVTQSRPDVTHSDGRAPMTRPNRPATSAPISGRRTMAVYMPSPSHHVDVLDRDRAPIAVEDHENGEADGGLGGRDGEHEHGEDLADQVAQIGREGDQVHVHGEQDQLDGHEDDDDVLPVEEDAEHADREQDGGDREVMR